jgi:hypothetical protein
LLIISVGLMLDPLTHVAFAYAEARGSRLERLSAALSTIGISVLMGGLSTAGSCTVMLFTTIVLFYRFAALFTSLMVLTLLYTIAFLAPLLALVGPDAHAREGDGAGTWCRRWRRPRRALTDSDAARPVDHGDLELVEGADG